MITNMKYSNKADALRKELVEAVNEQVRKKGTTNGFKTVKVIEVYAKIEFSIHDMPIYYIGENLLYDRYGNEYSFSDLGLDDFAELVDDLLKA